MEDRDRQRVQQVTEADWLTRARDSICAEALNLGRHSRSRSVQPNILPSLFSLCDSELVGVKSLFPRCVPVSLCCC
jgi:hypothetical protein